MNVGLENFATAAGELLWKGAIRGSAVLLAAWVICRFAALPGWLKCWIWRIAFLKILLLVTWVDPIELALLPPVQDDATYAPASTIPGFVPALGTTGSLQPEKRWLPLIIAALWIVGVIAFVGKLVREWLRLPQIARRRCGADSWITAEAAEVANRMSLKRVPPVRCSEEVDSPLIFGFCWPIILLPSKFVREFSAAELRMSLAHELAHMRRYDLVWSWLATACKVIFFFNPLVWFSDKEWRLAQEIACDECAVDVTQSDSELYGSLLLRLTRPNQEVMSFVGVGMAESSLKKRIQSLVQRVSWSKTPKLIAAACLIFMGIPAIIPWRVTAARSEINSTVAWGKPEAGIQLGLEQIIGGNGLASFRLKVRNLSPDEARISYPEPTVWKAAVIDQAVFLSPSPEGNQFTRTVSLNLKPGQAAPLFLEPVKLAVTAEPIEPVHAAVPSVHLEDGSYLVSATSAQSFMMLNNRAWPPNLRSGLLKLSTSNLKADAIPSISWGKPVNGVVAGASSIGPGSFQVYVRNLSEKIVAFTFRELSQTEWSHFLQLKNGGSQTKEISPSKPGPQVTLLLNPGERFLIGHPQLPSGDLADAGSAGFVLKQSGMVEVDGVVRPWSVNLATGYVPVKPVSKVLAAK